MEVILPKDYGFDSDEGDILEATSSHVDYGSDSNNEEILDGLYNSDGEGILDNDNEPALNITNFDSVPVEQPDYGEASTTPDKSPVRHHRYPHR